MTQNFLSYQWALEIYREVETIKTYGELRDQLHPSFSIGGFESGRRCRALGKERSKTIL